MNIPITFPSNTDVIRSEVARFRALSPAQRNRTIVGAMRLGGKIIAFSPKSEFLKNSLFEKNAHDRRIQQEILAKYAI